MRIAGTHQRPRRLVALVAFASMLAACGGNVDTVGNGNAVTSSTSSTSKSSGTDALSIGGTPATSVVAGQTYTFQPTASGASGTTLTYSIANLPSWATFSAATGALTGTPTDSEMGAYSGIAITVTDGTATAALPTFAITVNASAPEPGTATLSWVAPTENTDGTPLTDLAGYRVHYGTSSDALTQTIDVSGATATSLIVTGLDPGTYYFAVTALTSSGQESAPSDTASKTI